MSEDIQITDCSENFNTITFKVTGSAFGIPSSAKDVNCLVDGPKHNWYQLNQMYMKCSKCGMSYETTPEKGLIL